MTRRALALALLALLPSMAQIARGPDARADDLRIVIVGGAGVIDEGVAAALANCTATTVDRVAGPDRYATAANVAASFPAPVDTVYLATGERFPDALVAGPLAARHGSPVLLTAHDRLPASTRDELRRLAPSTIVVLGGTGAIAESVVVAAGAYGSVRRIAGADRFDTAAAASAATFAPGVETAYVATGLDFPDALAAIPAAALSQGPMLLSHPQRIPASTQRELERLQPRSIVIIGGRAAVGDGVADELASLTQGMVRRLAGIDRYATAAAVAEEIGGDTVFISTGGDFPDALAAGSAAHRGSGSVLLTTRHTIPPATARAIERITGRPCVSPTLLGLDERERVAIGDGVQIEARWEVGGPAALRFNDGTEVASIAATEPFEITFEYVAPGAVHPPEVTWTTTANPGQRVQGVQPWRRARPEPAGNIALVWLANGTTSSYLRQLDAAPGATVASPVCMFLHGDGSASNSCDPAFVAGAQRRGVAVWPAIAGFDADGHHLAFSDPDRRSRLAATVSQWARDLGANGVNLDIEGFRDEDGPAYTEFVGELAPLVHEWGGVLSHDLIPRTDDWLVTPEELSYWSTAPERRELAALTDYIVIMAYDEYNRFRPAGPVASPQWVEDNLQYMLRYEDPADILLGIPFYGRVWDPDDLSRPRAMGLSALAALAATGTGAPDPATGLVKVALPDGRFLWSETPAGLSHRMDLVRDFGLGGWAAWRLGFDSPDVWEVIGRR